MLLNGNGHDDVSFSVIIPTYQEGPFLGRTLSNITKVSESSGFKTEIIVVDGGSSDSTTEIARNYTKKVYNIKKRGIALARNFGARKARGSVLTFLDADVVVSGGFFEKIGNLFESNGIVGANCNVKPLPSIKPTYFERAFYFMWGEIKKVAYNIKPCGTGENGIIVRDQIFKKAGGFDESLHAIEDLDFVLRASKMGRFVFLKEPKIYESIRRFRKIGAMRFSSEYVSNFLYYSIFKDSRIKKWEPVR